ncbi:MAG: FAD-dependent oxidoreductase [Eubacterium sp.]|nr:FAD-dependent oxidoreductase [Candidatus Colimonas fimequi]
MMKYDRIFQPIKINSMELKNRIVMSALHHQYTDDGAPTPRLNEYYWRRAEGGVGLIVAGGMCIDGYKGYAGILDMSEDKFIPRFQEFTAGIHERGTKVIAEFMQVGRYGVKKYVYGDTETIAPSAVYSGYTRETPRAMTIEEIKTMQQNFVAATLRAKECGFDGVEYSAGSGYLLSQFLSPLTNLREDEYGGSWENRCRFAVEMVTMAREAVGPDFPLIMRVAGNDFMEGGNTNAECVEFCRVMEDAGIDMFDILGGWHETKVPQLPGDLPRGGFAYLAAAVKAAVNVPVMAGNRVNDPAVAEKLIALGMADLCGVARGHIADPDFVNKAREGRADEIRHCVACNQGCLARMFFGKPIECLVNGTAGREYEMKLELADTPKNILVVGAGPAGSEFALTAAARGHNVTLWDKADRIGGTLHIVAAAPAKGGFNTLIKYYEVMLAKNGVKVELGREGTAEDILAGGFDSVVIATGAVSKSLTLEGTEGIQVVSAADILSGDEVAGKNVVVIGGSSVGCEVAAYMAHEGSISAEQLYFMNAWRSETPEKIASLMNSSNRNIAVIDIAKIGAGFDPGCGWPVLLDLKRLGVKTLPTTTITGSATGVVSVEAYNNKKDETPHLELPPDTSVLAVGYASNNALYEAVKADAEAAGIEVYNLGDSAQVGKILDAAHAADDFAYTI